MTQKTIFKYKIFCQTDGRFEYVMLEEGSPVPTSCPVNTAHLCDLNLTSIDESILPSSVAVTSIPAMASKTLPDGKKLYKRVHGVRQEMSSGVNVIQWTTPYPHVKFIAIEFTGGLEGDQCDLEVYDTAMGTYSTIPNYKLNQFGFGANIAKEFYQHTSEFDADLYQGMIVKLTYNSPVAKNVGINFVMNEVKAT